MKIIGIGGEPGTGKTTLVKNIIRELSSLEKPKRFGFKLVRGMLWKQQKIIVIGVYSDAVFSGTDKLSMSVMPDMLEFLGSAADDPRYKNFTVLFEGDRLFCQKLIDFSYRKEAEEKVVCNFFLLNIEKAVQEQRLKKRSSRQQNTKWLASRTTKYQNILASRPSQIVQLSNDGDASLHENCKIILSKLLAI